MKILVYALSLLGLISMITASLIKGNKMKMILFFVFFGNVLVATSYLLDGQGINGAAACYLGGVMSIVNYFFDAKEKPIPTWLIGIYVFAIVFVNIWVAGGITTAGINIPWISLLVIVASLTFIMCIGQTNGAKYRFWTIVNMLLWCTYDIIAPAYPSLVTHVSLLNLTIAGMIIYDRKKKKIQDITA